MLKPEFTAQFKKDYKAAVKRGCDVEKLEKVIGLLVAEKKLPALYHDHSLENSRGYVNMRECHIQPDWLLIYEIDDSQLFLYLTRTGTHSDIF